MLNLRFLCTANGAYPRKDSPVQSGQAPLLRLTLFFNPQVLQSTVLEACNERVAAMFWFCLLLHRNETFPVVCVSCKHRPIRCYALLIVKNRRPWPLQA